MAGALLVASGVEGPPRGIGYLWVFFGSMGLSGALTSIAHELGHVAAAHLVEMGVVRVVVGSGPILIAREWQGIRFELRKFMLTGGATWAYHQVESPSKLRHAIMLLGGAAANLLLLVVGAGVFVVLVDRFAVSDPFVAAVFLGMLASQIFAIIENLIPHNVRRGHSVVASDGRQLIGLLRAKDFPRKAQETRILLRGMALLHRGQEAAAQAHFEREHRRFPANTMLFSLLVHSASKTAGPHAAVQYYLQNGGEFDTKNEGVNAWAYANVAWNAALTQDAAMLPLADDLSQRAIAALSTTPEVRGTRGAVLVEMGQIESGLELLAGAIRGVVEIDERARFALFLARGERARGNSELASEFERLSQHLLVVSRRHLSGRHSDRGTAVKKGTDGPGA